MPDAVSPTVELPSTSAACTRSASGASRASAASAAATAATVDSIAPRATSLFLAVSVAPSRTRAIASERLTTAAEVVVAARAWSWAPAATWLIVEAIWPEADPDWRAASLSCWLDAATPADADRTSRGRPQGCPARRHRPGSWSSRSARSSLLAAAIAAISCDPCSSRGASCDCMRRGEVVLGQPAEAAGQSADLVAHARHLGLDGPHAASDPARDQEGEHGSGEHDEDDATDESTSRSPTESLVAATVSCASSDTASVQVSSATSNTA